MRPRGKVKDMTDLTTDETERAAWLLTDGSVRAGECRLANFAVPGVSDNGDGYVRVTAGGRRWLGHRLVAAAMFGPLVDPDDADMPVHVHHSCAARSCVDPAHLVIADGRSNGLESARFAALEHAAAERYAELEQHLVDTHEERDAWRRRAEVAEAALARPTGPAARAADEWRERAVELAVQVAEEHELRLAVEEELDRARGEAARLYERLERPADPPSPDLFRVDL